LAQKALALDDSLPTAHQLLGHVYQARQQHEQAIAEAERAIVLAPNYANGYATLGQMLNVAGRPEDAIEVAEKALRLDPRNPSEALAALGNAYRLTGRYEEAIATFKKLQNFRDHPVAHMFLAIMYSEMGREEEARVEAAEILRVMPNFSLAEMKQRMPWKDQTRVERDLEALRKAGLN
jgi:adenylate cyclase